MGRHFWRRWTWRRFFRRNDWMIKIKLYLNKIKWKKIEKNYISYLTSMSNQ
jgi:hypothetical protein